LGLIFLSVLEGAAEAEGSVCLLVFLTSQQQEQQLQALQQHH